jgi:hypothetical protein
MMTILRKDVVDMPHRTASAVPGAAGVTGERMRKTIART